jgi:regulatory protein
MGDDRRSPSSPPSPRFERNDEAKAGKRGNATKLNTRPATRPDTFAVEYAGPHSRLGARQGVPAERVAADGVPAEDTPTLPVSTSRTAKSKPVRSLKGRALGYLSRREYSRVELSRKLVPFVEESTSLDALLDALEHEGLLSDSRFVESVVHRRAARFGANRIVSELKRHAVGDDLIKQVDSQLRDTEWARAQAVWQKKYGRLPQTGAERNKQARFLAMRGFSHGTIVKLLKGDDDWLDAGL